VTGAIIEEAATDLRFEVRGGAPLATGASRRLSREVGLKETRELAPMGQADHQKKADRKSRRKLRITAAVLFLGIGGVGFYAGQVNSILVEGVKERLGTWHKTLQGTLGGGIANPERHESPLLGDQISSVDERMTASTEKVGPASAARAGNDEVSLIGSVSEVASGREEPMVVPPGSTIAEIATNVYGAQRDLGLDLIKEYNSQIENLNRIRAGQRLWLPPLSQETLVRQQPDGSYRFILASFRTSQQAEQLAQLARLQSFDSVVSVRRVSNNLVLHRVEINRLANLEAVDRAWEIAVTNHWIALAANRPGKRF
jgi:hypothetical protein